MKQTVEAVVTPTQQALTELEKARAELKAALKQGRGARSVDDGRLLARTESALARVILLLGG